uniref:Uncharacterized protein n=1 Tax=Aplanochytrium stocchinoi TaxID=215587 RepID=A0A7S3PSH2_9STRA|mmetsp:Transcript_3331/g.4216  ORF Transcript_3331/g.4216 Transcript_3331/m.4216 type:complete len:188 (+) Transcript_3331:160-723(+)
MTLIVSPSFPVAEKAGRRRTLSETSFGQSPEVWYTNKQARVGDIIPPRPAGNGFAARLWDNLYNKGGNKTATSPLKKDVMTLLKKNSISSTKKQVFKLLGKQQAPLVRPQTKLVAETVSVNETVEEPVKKTKTLPRKMKTMKEINPRNQKFFTSHRRVSPFSSSSKVEAKIINADSVMNLFEEPTWL